MTEVQTTFEVATVAPSDTTAPIAVIAASNVAPADAGEVTYSFTVDYSDNVAVDEATLGSDDVVVTGPNGYSTSATFVSSITANGVVTATYEVTPPGGSWDELDDGTYTVTVQSGSVADTSANVVAEVQATFEASVSLPEPTSDIRINVGGNTYTDTFGNQWIADQYFQNGNTLSTGSDIANTNEDTIYQSARESKKSNKSFFYNVPIENGVYNLNLHFAEIKWTTAGERIFDVVVEGQLLQDELDVIAQAGSNNTAYQALLNDVVVNDGILDIQLAPGAVNKSMLSGIEILSGDPANDTSPPTANIAATNVGPADVGATSYTFTVDFSDNVAIDTATLGSGDVEVTGPNGFSTTATFISSTTVNGIVTATYQVTPPGGSWDELDDGTYTVTVQAGSVADTNANSVGAVQTTFDVAINDAVAPIASITASDIAVADTGATAYTFTIDYNDNIAIDVATLDNSDVVVTGPNGYSVTATFIESTTTLENTTATYQITPPGGSWDGADDGTYTVTVQSGSVTDTNANPVAESQAAFEVDINQPQPTTALRINAGGGNYTDTQGNQWVGDGAYNQKGRVITTSAEITRTEDDTIYQSHRQSKNSSSLVTFEIPVDNGNYAVNLHFSEYQFEDFGERAFDISIEGEQVFDDLDIYEKSKNAFFSGKDSALILNFQNINISDSALNLEFKDSISKAIVTGIEVIPIVGPQIILTQSGGDTKVFEGGDTDSYEIVLNTPPTSDVTIELQLEDQQLTADKTTLTFTPTNWNVPQSVTLTAVDDSLKEGTETYLITHTVSSADPDYENRLVTDVAATIGDNDVPVITFNQKTVASMIAPTRGTWGPDGRLYVASYLGEINAYTFDDDYNVTNVEAISTLMSVSNPNILGIAFNPFSTSEDPEIYVAHSLLYGNGGEPFPETELSVYSGQISVLSGSNFSTVTPLITGLPVSNHDHGINGLEFDADGDLLIAIGGNTNAGVTDDGIGGVPESPFSAAIVKAEITKPDFNGTIEYVLPPDFVPPAGLTFDPADSQTWGEIVDVAPGVDVSVYAAGLRNPFDVVLATSGLVYATDNGANKGGPASTSATTEEPFPESVPDELNLIVEGEYYGHPNRNLGRSEDRFNEYYYYDEESIPEVYTAPLATATSSNNGIDEYRATVFESQLRGNLISQTWNGETFRFELASDGQSVVSQESFDTISDGLDIVTGPGGAIVGIDLSDNSITVATPDDITLVGATKAFDVFPWRAPAIGGQEFVIGGIGFGDISDTIVQIGGQIADISYVSDTRIKGTFPTQTATGSLLDIEVTTAGEISIIEDAFLPLA